MITPDVVKAIQNKYALLQHELDERVRRLWAASEALALGHGGVAAVAKATGLAESTIRHGRTSKSIMQPLSTTVVFMMRPLSDGICEA